MLAVVPLSVGDCLSSTRLYLGRGGTWGCSGGGAEDALLNIRGSRADTDRGMAKGASSPAAAPVSGLAVLGASVR